MKEKNMEHEQFSNIPRIKNPVLKYFCVLMIIACSLIAIIYKYQFSKQNFTVKLPLMIKIKPPKFNLELQELSNQMQDKLLRFEENHSSCQNGVLRCGNYYPCGFGCQIHHRIICFMIAYALNVTLHHKYDYKWPYHQKWPDTFEHLTTRCKTRPNTLIVNFRPNPPELTEFISKKQIPFPLENGIPVPSELHEKLTKVHKFPFLWWIGQFATYTMKLVREQEEIIEKTKEEIGFKTPIVGIHVRRTDKVNEKQGVSLFHKLEDYMKVAELYYNSLVPKPPQPWRIFVASEDTEVFSEAQLNDFLEHNENRYTLPQWEIIGIPPNMTTPTWLDREEYLGEILRDVTLLSQCDFVVCGFSSNVCRLVYELMQARNSDSTDKVVSLDFRYSYIYSRHHLVPEVLNIL